MGPVREAMAQATVYANNAGLYMPGAAQLCLASLRSFGWPSAANAYITGPGLEVSVPAHTDRQDVLIFQATGRKRWQAFAPPAVAKDPLRRGKDGDVLQHLGTPLIDVVLEPGDVLYVPLGFPHATSTAELVSQEPSSHLTLNLDSVIWGLSWRLLWVTAVRHSRLTRGVQDEVEEAPCTEGWPWRRYASLQCPLPLGFAGGGDPGAEVPPELSRRARLWLTGDEETPVDEMPSKEDIDASLGMLVSHHGELMRLQQNMYFDVLLDLSKLPPMEREAAHWAQLQQEMNLLRVRLGWEPVPPSGLPYKATVADVMEFFSGYVQDQNQILMLTNPDRRPKGTAS
eukprot:s2884_g5.t1